MVSFSFYPTLSFLLSQALPLTMQLRHFFYDTTWISNPFKSSNRCINRKSIQSISFYPTLSFLLTLTLLLTMQLRHFFYDTTWISNPFKSSNRCINRKSIESFFMNLTFCWSNFSDCNYSSFGDFWSIILLYKDSRKTLTLLELEVVFQAVWQLDF